MVKRRFIVFLVFFVILTGLLTLVFWPFIRDLLNPEYRELFSAWVAGLGFKGVLVLFSVQMLQVVVAVIPGGPVQLIAGAAYGAWKGFLILEAGCAAATMLVFFLVRKFGLPFVRRFFRDDAIITWGFLANEKKTALLTFILFLMPGTPKDTLTYLAPLSRLSLTQFTLISVFARFPAMFSSTVIGDTAMKGNWGISLLIFGLTALSGILGIQFKDRVIRKFSSRGVSSFFSMEKNKNTDN